MSFTVGETVVYPNHGAAVIEDIEMRNIKGDLDKMKKANPNFVEVAARQVFKAPDIPSVADPLPKLQFTTAQKRRTELMKKRGDLRIGMPRVLNMYSMEKNERLRLKVYASADERVPSVQGVWATANWEEREVYDMFGVVFEGHPELKRILLPDEWQGYPLRKDYDILTQDTAWVRENLGIESGQ